MKNSGFFWIGYSDLMTSLFFIVLVLFMVTIALYKEKTNELEKQKESYKLEAEMLQEIRNIDNALAGLREDYFEFDPVYKRYIMKINVKFVKNKYNIPSSYEEDLIKAGDVLFEKIKSLIDENKDIDYLLVIECNAQRVKGYNKKETADGGYRLSYKRALSLYNLWQRHGNDFKGLGNQCEIIIAGSGYFGKSRNQFSEMNRRFTIQITPKIGRFLNIKSESDTIH